MEKADFDKLLKVTRISLGKDEKEKLSADINDILIFFDKINQFSSSNDYTFHPVEIDGKTREDTNVDKAENKDMLNNAERYRFFVIGPKV
ncbi:MAG: hypothetical protein BJBARM5_0073 [Candidatus Parvarchaeum acidophilus ARMAN-5]|jgi:aspartyl/glutamyl-tRNA(Asn/Gln) amidotransferase C subunit|uniref:Aspartyl/glutamyl-tRNA(Asn/Gln) amidotransferase subunit C n=1 Tax=Candidatus Parvarchaeum acidophilus ARMAN-5 TaxID=662762 RepID=D6GUE4_PARA5|nr:MAG: hypothetical protein BJBARM5_0073 [Candidatus Parvarchaeum acidophilus ARMAN-5]